MLKPRKKLTKKRIKEDKVLTYINKVTLFFQNEWQKLLSGITIVLLVIFVFSFVQKSNLEKEHQAESALAPYENLYIQQQFNDNLIAGLNTVISNHNGSGAGARAIFYLANTHFNLGNFEQAETYFRQFLQHSDGKDFMKGAAMSGIAQSYEERKMYKEAADSYMNALRNHPKSFLVPEFLIGAARSYLKVGNTEEARKQCQRILDEYRNSPQASDAEIFLAKI